MLPGVTCNLHKSINTSLCLCKYLKYSGLAGTNVTVLGKIIELIKIVSMGVVAGIPLGHLGLLLEPLHHRGFDVSQCNCASL